MPAKRFRPSDLACPLCGATAISRVIDSRVRQGDIKRRRECVKCAGRFTTFERVEGALLPSVDMLTAQQKDQVLRVAAAIADDDTGARVRGRRRVAA